MEHDDYANACAGALHLATKASVIDTQESELPPARIPIEQNLHRLGQRHAPDFKQKMKNDSASTRRRRGLASGALPLRRAALQTVDNPWRPCISFAADYPG